MGKPEQLSKDFALIQDEQDELRRFRSHFYLNEDEIYMDGNSLGLLSIEAEESLLGLLNEWKGLGINGWLKGEIPWFYYGEELAKLQAPLVGAKPEEVIVHGSTTSNLHSLLATFFHPEGGRNKLLMDELTFPSDRYAIESQLEMRGFSPEEHLIVVKSEDGKTLQEMDIIEQMTQDIALIILPSVLYRSGQLLDMKILTREAHKRNILIGFDCCHSVGAVPHYLSEWEVDFAFWCNYKYLNSGPGGTASLYINQKHFEKKPGLAGWFGYRKERQFDMSNEFHHELSAGGWQIGTPNLLSMAPLEGSLKLFHQAGIERIREKSLKLTDYMMFLIQERLQTYGFIIGNPKDSARRGGHVALEHKEAARINEALKDRGIIPDFRYPNVIRLAPVALYNSFYDVWKVIDTILDIMDKEEYRQYENKANVVA